MLSEWIEKAYAGEAVWMSDLRAAFAGDPEAVRLPVRLHLIGGGLLDYLCFLPRWHTPEERRFVEEYFFAFVYNLLSVFSGQSLIFSLTPIIARQQNCLQLFTRSLRSVLRQDSAGVMAR